MKLSTLTKADNQVLLYRKAITVLQSMQRRHSWYTKHHPDRLTPLHSQRTQEIQLTLEKDARHFLDNILIKDLHAELNSDSDLIEMNLYPQRGSKVLARPVAELLNWAFEGLPPPGKAQHTPFQQALCDMMNEKGRLSRGNVHRFAIAAETAYRTKLGWFMIFNTLTVEPGSYYKVFNKQSKEFKNYVRQFQRSIDQAETGGPINPGQPERPQQSCNHTYCAVVEEGGKFGRLHIHVLHFVRALPRGCKDPNYGKRLPSNREISCLKRLWAHHGHSTPIAVRTSDLDAYGKLGWRWPWDVKKNRPLRFRSPQAVAGYMSKYITKGYNSSKRQKLLWRIRKTHGLGQPVLLHLLSKLTPAQLLNLSSNSSLTLKLNNRKIPTPTLQLAALRHYRFRRESSTQPSVSLLHLAKRVTPQASLLHSSTASTLETLTNNLRNMSGTLIDECSLAVTSEQTRAAAQAAALLTDRTFYPRSFNAYGTTSTIN